jgi:hypothetical protein
VAVLDEIGWGVPSHVTADLTARPQVSADEIRERMSGNICRCGAYSNILDAITEVAGKARSKPERNDTDDSDIPHQEVIFIDETDPMSSPMKAKGVGELGLCGVGAAIGNAIYNATGVRVRDYPVTLDKLLPKMPVFR